MEFIFCKVQGLNFVYVLIAILVEYWSSEINILNGRVVKMPDTVNTCHIL